MKKLATVWSCSDVWNIKIRIFLLTIYSNLIPFSLTSVFYTCLQDTLMHLCDTNGYTPKAKHQCIYQCYVALTPFTFICQYIFNIFVFFLFAALCYDQLLLRHTVDPSLIEVFYIWCYCLGCVLWKCSKAGWNTL